MKKTILTIVLTFLLLFKAEAQQGEVIGSVSAGYLVPTGDFANFIEQGIGIGLHGKYFLTDNFSAGVNLSSSYLFSKASLDQVFNMDQFHLCSDYFFLTDEIKPYLGVDFGYTQYQNATAITDTKRKLDNFSYGFVGGVMYLFNEQVGGNAFAKFNSIDSKDSFFLLGLGLTYKMD